MSLFSMIGNLIAEAIGGLMLRAAFKALESQRGEIPNKERYPRHFSFKLNANRYGTMKRRKALLFMQQEKKTLKSLGWRVVGGS